MSKADTEAAKAPRVTEADAVALARSTFERNERVDMNTLASELGIGRATLYRWVDTREDLLDRVLGELTGEFFEPSRLEALSHPDDIAPEMVRIITDATVGFEPLRGFVQREPELALRLLIGRDRLVRRRLVEGFEDLVAEAYPAERESLQGFADAAVQVGVALVWPTLVAGDEPSGAESAAIVRALLAGARSGELQLPG